MTDRKSTKTDNDKNAPEGRQLTEIEAEIDQTRNAISGDLRTLGERLSPENLKEDAKEVVHEAKNAAVETLHEARDAATYAFREAKDSAVETVSAKVNEWKDDVRRVERETVGFLRENAVPLSLIGVGLTWFFMQRRTRESEWDRQYRWGAAGEAARGYPTDSDWRDSAESTFGRTKERAREFTNQASERAREFTNQAGGRAQRWAENAEHSASDAAGRVRSFAQREVDEARHMARDAEHKVSEAAEQARNFASRELRQARDFSTRATETHPLAVAAAALAAGIGVGLAIPQTRRETEMLGAQRERLVGGAKEIIEDWSQAAGETARDMKDSLTGARA